MAHGLGPQQTNQFPIRSSRWRRRYRPYPLNTPTLHRAATVRTITRAVWQANVTGLRAALGELKAGLNGLPSLQSAIGKLGDCLTHLPLQWQTRSEYEGFVSCLADLVGLLRTKIVQSNRRTLPHSIASFIQDIEEQTNLIEGRQEQIRTGQLKSNDEGTFVLECHKKIGALCQQLKDDINSSVWDKTLAQQMDTQLGRLLPAYEAYYNAALPTTATQRSGCTKNTRVDLLDGAWEWVRADDGAKIYWLNGMAGTGKTTIAYTMSKMLDDNKRLGGSFFCSRNSPDCRDVNRIVPTIAYQLGRYSSSYRQMLCDVLDDDPDIVRKDVGTQFERLISKPLRDIERAMPSNVVVVLDALDECTDARGTNVILNMLLLHASGLPLKFYVASRPEPDIFHRMTEGGGAMRSILWLHDIEKSLVQADIKTYLIEALKSVQVSSAELDAIADRADCLFIFAATAVRYISPDRSSVNHRQRLLTVLNLHPNRGAKSYKDIDNLYVTILASAFDEALFEEEELAQRRCLLWSVVCAREALTISALIELLNMPDVQAVELAIQPLQSVLHVSDSSCLVTTLHASFPDFLLSKDRAGRFLCDEVMQNVYLAENCFKLMGRSLQFNICALQSSYVLDRDVPDLKNRTNRAISAELFYSCKYWSDHLVKCPVSPPLLFLLDAFLRQRLLFWMEVLNLKRRIGDGDDALTQALAWLSTKSEAVHLLDFTHDARSFLTTFGSNPTSLSTPHIYLSTLPFTPKNSHIWETYWPRTQGLIRVEGAELGAQGNSALASWAAESSVHSIASSGDGKRIVSGSGAGFDFRASRLGSGQVTIWDTPSGTPLIGPLKGHDRPVLSVAFSPGDIRIASSSEDRLCIWDASTGHLIVSHVYDPPPRMTPDNPPQSLSFSPDGAHLALSSGDRTVRIWDTYSCTVLGDALEGHQGDVRSVVFSPDGKHLASGSEDHTTRIWDWRTRTMALEPLQGHTAAVHSIAYSRDGLYLVSGSADYTIRAWDVSSGALLAGPFEGHRHTVTSVSFSPNGTRIASGSSDREICVWDVESGTLFAGPLEGHKWPINSVLFTADGTRILSGSDDSTIRVWETRHGTTDRTKSFGRHGTIRSITLSPDGTRIAYGLNNAVCILDTHNGALVAAPFKGHTGEISSVIFSPDGTCIASGSYDGALRIWDASTGSLLVGPIEGHAGYVSSVTFSPDGRQIASDLGGRFIRLWDSHTGESVAEPFKGHAHQVMSIAYSPNGTRIVSGSRDFTVRMWNVNESTRLWTSNVHNMHVTCVAFSPDGTRIVSASRTATVVLDAHDGVVLHGPFTDHINLARTLAFFPNGTLVVSGCLDGAVRVWDVRTGATVAGLLEGHTGELIYVAFSADGAQIISASTDTIRFWDVAAATNPSAISQYEGHADDRGWLTNSESQLLLWVPPSLRKELALLRPSNPITITDNYSIYFDSSGLLLGDKWHQCYDPSA